MNDKVNEQISAWVDGELPERELELLLARMESDPALAARWERYHLIQDALRNRLPAQVVPGFADRVQAAIAGDGDTFSSTPARGLPRWLKPVAGTAIAASVAAAMVLVMQPQGQPDSALVVVAQAPVAAPAGDQYRRVAGTRWDVERPRVGDHLNQYLVNHNEFAARHGLPAVSAHVRVVSYDPGAGAE